MITTSLSQYDLTLKVLIINAADIVLIFLAFFRENKMLYFM